MPSTLEKIKGSSYYFACTLSTSPLPVSAPAHFALVDSGASIHILLCHTFLTDSESNHSAVASFSGSTSRATHKGTFTALMRCTRNKYHTFVQPDSALVVPDASRILFSISQALTAGHHVHFGTNPGLLLHGNKQFIPFVKDEQSGMFLLPLYPPLTRHNGTCRWCRPLRCERTVSVIGQRQFQSQNGTSR